MKSVYLDTNSLFSKFGFCDGDVLDEFMWDYEPAQGGRLTGKPGSRVEFLGFDHALLVRLVKKHLLPLVPRPVETYQICSIHNPLRAEDGVVNDFYAEVTVPYDAVAAEADALLAEECE